MSCQETAVRRQASLPRSIRRRQAGETQDDNSATGLATPMTTVELVRYAGVMRNRATVTAAVYWNTTDDAIFFTQSGRYTAAARPGGPGGCHGGQRAAVHAFWQDVLDSRYSGVTQPFTTVNGTVGVKWFDDRVTTRLKVNNLANRTVVQFVFGGIPKTADRRRG